METAWGLQEVPMETMGGVLYISFTSKIASSMFNVNAEVLCTIGLEERLNSNVRYSYHHESECAYEA